MRDDVARCGTTLLTIAHRLHTVIDYDRIVEMSAGQAIAMAQPAHLLRDPARLLSQLVAVTDGETQQTLRDAAEAAAAGKQPQVAAFR